MIEKKADSVREWDIDKRSWLFYVEDIRKNEDMIYGEFENICYFFDFDTAKLSIWDGEWNTFIEVGVSRLIQQMQYHDGTSGTQLQRMRMLYKGIDFFCDYDGGDTEFLEFIDIKGDLERRYVNIDRKGFTEAGERYFRDILYPGLMRDVKRVLNHLEQWKDETEKGESFKSFDQKTKDVIEAKCKKIKDFRENRDDQNVINAEQNLLVFIVSVCVLSYYATRDEWNLMEKLTSERRKERKWQLLIKNIDSLLKEPSSEELVRSLSKRSYLFNIDSYTGDDYMIKDDRGERRRKTNIVEIFLEGRHWGILRCRRGGFGDWVSQLVALGAEGSDNNSYKKLTMVLRDTLDEEEIEKWGNEKCDIRNEGIINRLMKAENPQSQIFLNWLLKNVPTIGIFCNQNGNITFNVLGGRIYPSVYMNRNCKYEILQKMMDEAESKEIQRFSTVIWQKREAVGCRDLPFSIFFVKFGLLPEYSYFRGIVPIEGRVLKAWKGYLKSGNFKDWSEKLSDLTSHMNIVECLNKNVLFALANNNQEFRKYYNYDKNNIALEIGNAWTDLIVSRIRDGYFTPRIEADQFREYPFSKIFNVWMSIYQDVGYIYFSSAKGIVIDEKMTTVEEFFKKWGECTEFIILCDAWLYCTIHRDSLININWVSSIHEELKDAESEKKMEKMLSYLEDHQIFNLTREELKASMGNYEKEYVELVQGLVERIVSTVIDSNLEGCEAISKGIRGAYYKINGKVK